MVEKRDNKRSYPEFLPQDIDLLYGQEIASFLTGFGNLLTPEQALAQVSALWQKKGFIPPEELTQILYKKLLTEKSMARRLEREILVDRFVASHYDYDMLSGFLRAEHAPQLIGLAHLYSHVTKVPTILLKGTFSNVAGTVEFAKQAQGSEKIEDGEHICNVAMRIMLQIVRQVFEQALIEREIGIGRPPVTQGFVHGVRLSGDSFGIVISGVDLPDVYAVMLQKIIWDLEIFLATAGLHDHPNPQAQNPNMEKGLGLSLAARDLTSMPFEEWPKANKGFWDELYAETDGMRQIFQQLRRGDAVSQVIESGVSSLSGVAQQVIKANKDEFIKLAVKKMDMVRHIQQKGHLLALMSAIGQGHSFYTPYANILIRSPFTPFRMQGWLEKPFENPTHLQHTAFDHYARRMLGLEPAHPDYQVMDQAMKGYTPIDPASGAKGWRDAPAMAAYYAEQGLFLAKKLGEKPDENQPYAAQFNVMNTDLTELGKVTLAIKATMKKLNLGTYDHQIYHKGGGQFVVLLPNYVSYNNKGDSHLHFKPEDVADLISRAVDQIKAQLDGADVITGFISLPHGQRGGYLLNVVLQDKMQKAMLKANAA